MKSEPLELVLYWRSIWKRKWMILAVAAIFAAVAWFIASTIPSTYRASATLLIEQSKAKLVSIEEVYSAISPNPEHYQTQAEMLKAPAVAAKVIERLKLADQPEFDPRQRGADDWLGHVFFGRASLDKGQWTKEAVEAAVLADVLQRLRVEPVRLTYLVKLSFDAKDADLSARVANAFAQVYVEADIEARARITELAGDQLGERLSLLKRNLEDSERALQQYRESAALPDTRGLAQSGSARQIEELTRGLNEARQRRVEAEITYRQSGRVEEHKLKSLPVVLQAPFLGRLKEQESQAEKNVSALSKYYGPDHPRLLQAQRELERARERTKHGIEAAVASFAKEYEAAVAKERALESALSEAKNSLRDINRKEFQLEALEQDVAANRQLYERFLSRYRETRAAGDTVNAVARVIEPASAPTEPYKPRKESLVQLAFVFGLALAAIGALLRERLDNAVRSSSEVEEKLCLPSIAVLPLLPSRERERAGCHYLEQPRSIFSEAIRTARTSILLSAVGADKKILLVTSSLANEGKSAFAMNFALAHAQSSRTILVEADLRRPTLVGQLGLAADKPGLTDLLSGSAALSQCVQRVAGSALYVLPSGRPPDSPLELLSSERFRELLNGIAAQCDSVVIDSPPVHLVSDPVVLATMATGIIFVVKAGRTPSPLARRSIRTLQQAGGRVIGVALNEVNFADAEYYGGYTEYASKYSHYYSKPASSS